MGCGCGGGAPDGRFFAARSQWETMRQRSALPSGLRWGCARKCRARIRAAGQKSCCCSTKTAARRAGRNTMRRVRRYRARAGWQGWRQSAGRCSGAWGAWGFLVGSGDGLGWRFRLHKKETALRCGFICERLKTVFQAASTNSHRALYRRRINIRQAIIQRIRFALKLHAKQMPTAGDAGVIGERSAQGMALVQGGD